jgi:bifunctional non-homologous end joining protein LigD
MVEAARDKDGKLGDYERKRDLSATPEPAASGRRRKGAPRFVVQEHSARRLHWDLRLEHDGVAASWAIPNGVPTDPKESRKAIRTEDHPLEYLDFEGEIPAGQYGAGTMRIWDRGTYELEKWELEKVMFKLEGERLSGRYALFRAGESERDWMIHRIDPPAEQRDPFPASVVPMLAKLAELPAKDAGWAAELKWDGVRAIAYCQPGRLQLQSRNLLDITRQYPEVRRLTRQLGTRDAVLDGELVAFDEAGRPSFERLQQRIHQTDESVVRRRMKTHPVTYVLFDLLYLDGRDLMGETYERRRELLAALDLNGTSWQAPDYSVGHARELLAASAEQQLEGLVLKRLDSVYVPGKRGGSWLKVKNLGRQEFVIGGWVEGEGRRRNSLGSILLGHFDEQGRLHYAGKVGTGFSERDLRQLLARLRPLGREGNPFLGRRGPRNAHHVEPVLVAEIEFREMTAEGMVRHGSFKGLREDKAAAEVGIELPEPAWYGQVAELLLPHLRGRVTEERDSELYVSLALESEPERPTAVVLELQPGGSTGALDCAEVALWIRGMLEQLGLSAYPKTSGLGCLQVYVPLNTEVTYRETSAFAKAVAETLAGKFPERVVAGRPKRERGEGVQVDWSQNAPDAKPLCVYSLRAGDRQAVSTPLEWDEVEAALESKGPDALDFDPTTALGRLEAKGDLFAPVLSEKQSLPG